MLYQSVAWCGSLFLGDGYHFRVGSANADLRHPLQAPTRPVAPSHDECLGISLPKIRLTSLCVALGGGGGGREATGST